MEAVSSVSDNAIKYSKNPGLAFVFLNPSP